MKQKNIIVALGIISMILLVSQSADASYVAYTKAGYPACTNLFDFRDASLFFNQGDFEAVAKMVDQGRCILLKPDVQVYAWNPLYEMYPNWIQIHAVGSTVTLWTFKAALEERTQEKPVVAPRSKRRAVTLTSLSWIKVGKTTRQEIIQKYGKPVTSDETGGEYLYYGDLWGDNRFPDFKGWERIYFIFDGDVLAEIRAEKLWE